MQASLLHFFAVPILVGAASTQTFLHRTSAPAGSARFGEICAAIGDVDGDGVTDMLCGAPGSSRAFVISGASGAVLRTHVSPSPGDRYGTACAGVEDIDLDGRADYAIGAPGLFGSAVTGVVRVYSGQTGALLRTHTAAGPGTEFGGSIAGAGDLNGDGWPDYVAGELFFGPAFAPPGQLTAFSGRDASVLFAELGHNGIGQLGYRVAVIGDTNGDRVDDVFASEPGYGQAVLYSGLDHSILRVEPWTFGFFFWGSVLDAVGDVNGDGRADYAIGTTDYVGLVRIVSGIDGSTLYEFSGSVDGALLGSAVLGLGDLNHDGRGEFAIATSRDAAGGANAGRVRVYSGATGTVLATLTGAAGDEFGATLTRLSDTDGDGWPELGIGRPGVGAVDVYSLRLLGRPSGTSYRVQGCPTSTGNLPRLRIFGEAILGRSITLRMTGGRPSPVAALNLGVEWNLPLGALAPGCIVHAYPLDLLGTGLDANGAADRSYPLPNDASFVGIVLSWQALTIDPANNPLGVAATNGCQMRLGLEPRTTSLGTLGGGVRGQDSATGTGYLMYTAESVATRFASSPVPTTTARNLVIVRYQTATSTWVYDNDSSYVTFTPRATDVLLADLNFTSDTATLMANRFAVIQGISGGYVSSNLVITPNTFSGSSNSGEFGIAGTNFVR